LPQSRESGSVARDAAPTLLTLGHSPDPDDAFMFYALAEGKIDTGRWRFEHILQDIETLNQRATRGELHISAVSIHAYASVLDKYALLPCGASMGDGYGPMLIARQDSEIPEASDDATLRTWLSQKTIAVPGTMTSAFWHCGCISASSASSRFRSTRFSSTSRAVLPMWA
jgi:1,4-dihydroxy-6-naphthoate synthase